MHSLTALLSVLKVDSSIISKININNLLFGAKIFPDSHFDSFYPQNLVPDPQKLGARVLSDAYMINPKLYLYIYRFIF